MGNTLRKSTQTESWDVPSSAGDDSYKKISELTHTSEQGDAVSESGYAQMESQKVSEKFSQLTQWTDDIMAQALDSSTPIEERIKLLNHPTITELMRFFQETKKNPDTDARKYADMAGKQIDTIYEQFQIPMQEYSTWQTQKFLTQMHQQEDGVRQDEQRLVQSGLRQIENGPLWFDNPFLV